MERHHEVWKSLSPWLTSQRNEFVSLVVPWVQSAVQRSRWKWAVMDKTSQRESQESLWMRRRAALWVVGHFPFRSWLKCDIRSASRLILFSVIRLFRSPILNQLLNFLACFATVADGSDMPGCTGVLAASWNWARRAKTKSWQWCFHQ